MQIARGEHRMRAGVIREGSHRRNDDRQAAPAIYRATRPHLLQRSVTCERGSGGTWSGERSIGPEHEGQLSGEPVRSLAIRWRACAGLYVAGRGFLMATPELALRCRKTRAALAAPREKITDPFYNAK